MTSLSRDGLHVSISKLYNRHASDSKSATTSSSILNRLSQKERVKRVHQTCSKYEHLLELPAYKAHIPAYNVAPTYNWSYCKIGKIGSTFWTQFFYIMHHKGDEVNNVLRVNRENIHNAEILSILNLTLLDSTRVVLSARNPYTRLFSAYIDRMFIPSTTPSIRGPTDNKCTSQITFSEFLSYAIQTSKHGDYHWSPIFYMCKPCEINPSFVFKLETFKEDFSDIMNQTALEPYKLDVLKQAIRGQANWSGLAVVDDIFGFIAPLNKRNTLDCQTHEQLTKRLWAGLKIQGHISESAPFPSERYKSEDDFKNLDIFHRAMIEANYPLPKAASTLQRRRFLNRFYENINPKLIKGIQEAYYVDFEMFGYSYDAPPWY